MAHLPRRLAACLLLAVALPAAAQWKWRDATGRIQYSDRPPPAAVADRDILQRPGPTSPAATAAAAPAERAASAPPLALGAASAASGARVDPALEAKRREAEQAEAARKKAEADKLAAVRADNCQRARAQLRALDEGVRMSRINEKGEREILDDSGRAAEAQRMRGIVASDCR